MNPHRIPCKAQPDAGALYDVERLVSLQKELPQRRRKAWVAFGLASAGVFLLGLAAVIRFGQISGWW